jgi:hypothetical protein
MAVFKVVNCPSCGASKDIDNPAVLQATCDYCHTVFIFDENAVKDTGKKSQLMPAISGFKIGMDGILRGKSFTVMGRVQYKFAHQGSDEVTAKWDEWFIQFSDGSTGWVNEDMGTLSYEERIADNQKFLASSIHIGSTVTLEGKKYQIRVLGQAICSGAEGQLPFPVIPDETYPFLDGLCISDETVLSAEFEGDEVLFFAGRNLNKNEITYQKDIVAEEKRQTEALRCPSCASPLETHNMDLYEFTITCKACTTVSQFSENTGVALGKVKKDGAKVFSIDLGAKGTLYGSEWMVVGRLRRDWSEEGETGYEIEYLLYNVDNGYMWLSSEDGHYYTGVPSDERPEFPILGNVVVPKVGVMMGKTVYKFYESGENTLTYVDGVLPWLAKIGDRLKYTDVINPPFVITEEQELGKDGKVQEIEYSKSTYIDSQEVAKAFSVSLPSSYGVSPGQPYKKLPFQRIMSLASVVIAFFFMYSVCSLPPAEPVATETFDLNELKTKEVYTRPFTIDKVDETIQIQMRATVDNSWASVAIGLVDAKKDMLISDEELVAEYYYGVEDGESWSEGSREQSIYWKIKEPGEYKLLLAVTETDTPKATVSINITKNEYVSYPLILWALVWLCQPIYFWVRKWFFEQARWSKVIEDDDDD